MTFRLRVKRGGQTREFAFDRGEVSIGSAPFNDIVIDGASLGDVQGTFSVGETLTFECDACGGTTEHRRDGTALEEAGADDSRVLEVRPGDVLRFQGDRPVEVHIVDVGESAEPGLEFYSLATGSEIARSTAGRPVVLEAVEAVAAEPGIERFFRVVAGALETVVGQEPERLTLSLLAEDPGLEQQVFRFEPADDTDPDEASGVAGEFQRRESPLMGLMGDRRRIGESLGDDEFGVVDRDDSCQVFWRLGGGSRGALLDVEFHGAFDETRRDGVAVVARMLGAVGQLVIEGTFQEFENSSLAAENQYFRYRERRNYLFKDVVCESEAMTEVYEQLNAWVDTEHPVLLVGEAGSGKGLVARALHHLGPGSERALLSLDCRALSAEILDRELFGCARGNAEDAATPRKGVFELANAGTVFLEEIDLLPMTLQCKLVRVLKEGEVRRVGGAVSRRVRARFVASTHRDLHELVEQGRFRRDLYLLLQSRRLEVPPLRERREDILPLARTFLKTFADRYERDVGEFGPEVVERLEEHQWSGNVRELQTFVESAVLNTEPGDERVEIEHLSL